MTNQKAGNITIIGGGARCSVLLPFIVERKDFKITAIVERDNEARKKLKTLLKELGIKDVSFFDSIEKFSQEPIKAKPNDAAFILTPEWTHKNIFERLLKKNYNIFIEKPLATTKDDVLKIRQLSLKSDLVIQVGFVLRHTQFYRTIKELVEKGTLGTLVLFEMSERLDPISGASNRRRWHRLTKYTGGFLNEKSSHDLDIMCWLKEKQATPRKIFSHSGRNFFNKNVSSQVCGECDDVDCPYKFKGDINQNSYNAVGKIAPDTCVYNSDADIADNQSVFISFEDGTQGIFTLLNVSGTPGREIRIHGTEGSLYGKVEDATLELNLYRSNTKRIFEIPNSKCGHYGGDREILGDFFNAIKRGESHIANVDAGVRASLLAFTADESAAKERIVNFEMPINSQ